MDRPTNNTVLKCISFNCRGLNDSRKWYIRELLEKCDVLFLQEHWQSDEQLEGLKTLGIDNFAIGVSGFGCSDVLPGRPYGGCAIFWRKNLCFDVTPICTNSNRICALTLSSTDCKLL